MQKWAVVLATSLLILSALIVACRRPSRPAAAVEGAKNVQVAETLLPPEATPPHEEYPALHNLMHLTASIYSGGEPENEQAFAQLQKLGVKTVVSVDGAKPNLELAHKYGLNYVHIPFGYDGVSPEAGKSLAQLMRTGEGPFYIHCHHGTHRGPAGAAIACIAAGAASHEEARQILERAGTSKNYAGLWRDVAAYMPPAEHARLPALVEVAKVGDMTAAMSAADRSKDKLKLCQEAGWSAPAEHPDIVPAQEALLLRETFHEAGRNLSGDYDAPFVEMMSQSETIATELEAALRAGQHEVATRRMAELEKSCKECHVKYRD